MIKKLSYSMLALFGFITKTNAGFDQNFALDAVYYSASAYCDAS